MKGIILAGGYGTRLFPLTRVVSKQLLPVYNKPMIYYPLSVLMMAGIRDILIISTPYDLPNFQKLFRDGREIGINLSYVEQPSPDGLAQAFILGKEFLAGSPACLILGDNLFFANGFTNILKNCSQLQDGGIIFAHKVKDPERYGVIEFDDSGKAISLEEKPKQPRSNYAVPGIYFYDNQVCHLAENLKPSARGELEITDLNREYLKMGKLKVQALGRGAVWMDTGTHKSLQEAANFIQAIEEHQGLQIGCIEEIAYNAGWIDNEQLKRIVEEMGQGSYAQYLASVARGEN